MSGVSRDSKQGFRYGPKKNAINLAPILKCQRADLLRQRKYNMEVRDLQQFGFPLGQPFSARHGLLRHELYEMTRCPHSSHWSTWPPRTAVRQSRIASNAFL